MLDLKDVCAKVPMVPVLTIEAADDAVPLAKALIAGGLPVLEITLRTSVALRAIEAISAACPDAIVGAGTLRTAADVKSCIDAGTRFGVSPGAPAGLMDAVDAASFPFLPGCATATEAMSLADRGYAVMKFFPAEAAGGVSLLRSLAAPLPDIRFCPTGGISLENAAAYLALPNVVTVGGSWVTPANLLKSRDWAAIEQVTRETVACLTRK